MASDTDLPATTEEDSKHPSSQGTLKRTKSEIMKQDMSGESSKSPASQGALKRTTSDVLKQDTRGDTSRSPSSQGTLKRTTSETSKQDDSPVRIPNQRTPEPSQSPPLSSKWDFLRPRSQSLIDLQGSSHASRMSRRLSSKDVSNPAGSNPKRLTSKESFGSSGVGASEKRKRWGLSKVMARHEWLTDEGDDDCEPQEESKPRVSGWRRLAEERGIGRRSFEPPRPCSRKSLDNDGSLDRKGSGKSEQGSSEGGGNRLPVLPRLFTPPQTALDEQHRSHYLHTDLPGGVGAGAFQGEAIESSSAPVKMFPGERRPGGGDLEDAALQLGDAKSAGSLQISTFGGDSQKPRMGRIAEHSSYEHLTGGEIEAFDSRAGNNSLRRNDSKLTPGGTEFDDPGRVVDSQRRGGDPGQNEAERDPFDNQFEVLPGTQAYGMTQVDDDAFQDTIQSTTQGGDNLGVQFKATWQEWQNRYKGVDAVQYAPSDRSDGGSPGRVARRRKRWWEWLRPPMIHPFSRAHRDINVVITLAIVYTMFTLPFELCFDVSITGGWLAIEFLVDVIFLVDVVMNFRTGYVEKQRDEVHEGLRIIRPQKIVMRPRKVARHYLRTWFLIDLVSSLPYDLLLVPNVGHQTVNVVQFLRLFRLFRLHRLMLAQAELQETWTTTQYEIVEMCLSFFYLIYLAHVGACIFAFIGRMENSPQRWLEQFNYNRNGEAAPLAQAKPFVKYSAAFYWSIITVSSVGYGDIYPSTTRAERIFATLFITVEAIFMGYLGGNIAALLILRGQRTSVRREKFSTLHAFIDKENIPEWLATRITVHMTRQWNLQAADFDEEQMLEDLTEELRMDLMVHWWRRSVTESHLFPHKRSFLIMLLEKCHTEQLAPGVVLCQAGELLRHVYVLRHGKLRITESDTAPRSTATSLAGGSLNGSDSDTSIGRQQVVPDESLPGREDETEDPSSSEAPAEFFAEPGTILVERSLKRLILQTSRNAPPTKSKRDKGLKSIRVKHVRMDLTAVCDEECTVMGCLVSDVFDVLERFPGLVFALKASLREELIDEMTATRARVRNDRDIGDAEEV